MNKSIVSKFIISTIVIGIILFAWVGISQNIPWGIPTTNTITSSTQALEEGTNKDNPDYFPSNELTTDKFDEIMVNNVSTLTTDKTFSWIFSKPLSYYNTGRYLVIEFFTQIIIAMLLSSILMLTKEKQLKKRIVLVLLMGVITTVSSYGRLTNWSGLTGIFAIGESVNLILGWLLGSFISAKFIIKSEV